MDRPTACGHEGRPGFVTVTCGRSACPHAPGRDQMNRLRRTVRSTPHGILVSAHCLIGLCTRRRDHAGPPQHGFSAIVQPAESGTTPTGLPYLVGPIGTAEELARLCGWLAAPRPGTGGPPGGLASRVRRPDATSQD